MPYLCRRVCTRVYTLGRRCPILIHSFCWCNQIGFGSYIILQLDRNATVYSQQWLEVTSYIPYIYIYIYIYIRCGRRVWYGLVHQSGESWIAGHMALWLRLQNARLACERSRGRPSSPHSTVNYSGIVIILMCIIKQYLHYLSF